MKTKWIASPAQPYVRLKWAISICLRMLYMHNYAVSSVMLLFGVRKGCVTHEVYCSSSLSEKIAVAEIACLCMFFVLSFLSICTPMGGKMDIAIGMCCLSVYLWWPVQQIHNGLSVDFLANSSIVMLLLQTKPGHLVTLESKKTERKFCYNCGAGGHFGHVRLNIVCIWFNLLLFAYMCWSDTVMWNDVMLLKLRRLFVSL